jgi:cytochrome c553
MRVSAKSVLGAVLVFAAIWPAQSQSVPERVSACLACHGESGQSTTPEVPSLGGLPEFYLTVQLVMFRERMRPIEPMASLLKGSSDRDLRAMAAFIAKLPPPKPVAEADAARMGAARTLAQQNRCNFCHTANYGGQENVPRIAGQREDYLLKTLREYKSETRRGYDASMADVVQALRDEDFAELAYFLSRQP